MSTERRAASYPFSAPLRFTARAVSYWCLRWRLRRLYLQIDVLERQLAGEFATLDTAPMHDALARLRATCDELECRLLTQQ